MDYSEFVADLRRPTLAFSSAEENEETMRRLGVTQRVRQLGSGPFRCHMSVRTTDDAEIYADRFSKAVSIYLESPENAVGLLLPRSASERFLVSGNNVPNDSLLFMPSGSGADIAIPDLAGSETIAIPEARFAEMAEALCPTVALPEMVAVVQGDASTLSVARRDILHLAAHPESDSSRETVANIVGELIAWMAESSAVWKPEGLNTSWARRCVAKQAQECIEDSYSETLSIEDLCRATGVGVRTLQRTFRKYFDVTITEYLKTVRLDAAHRQLSTADPAQTSVTSIGFTSGFSHLGRFSVEFRERFGEPPSAVLGSRKTARIR